MTEQTNHEEFTIEDIMANRVDEPVIDTADMAIMMARGAERIKQSLLAAAVERALEDNEIGQLSMLFGATESTQEFALFVLSQGREA